MRHLASPAGFSLKERRFLYLLKETWPNIKTWGADVGSTYFTQGVEEKDPIKIVAGVPMAALSLLFEAPDYVYAGIVDEKLKTPEGTLTGRDIKKIVTNNVRHPIRTLLSGIRLISDVPMDIADTMLGFKHNSTAMIQAQTRNELSRTLATYTHPNHLNWSERYSLPKARVIPSSRSPWEHLRHSGRHGRPPMGVSEGIRHAIRTEAIHSA